MEAPKSLCMRKVSFGWKYGLHLQADYQCMWWNEIFASEISLISYVQPFMKILHKKMENLVEVYYKSAENMNYVDDF